jgi:hypothetical protein
VHGLVHPLRSRGYGLVDTDPLDDSDVTALGRHLLADIAR